MKILNKENTFAEMALKYSQDPSAKQAGGSLGFLKRGTLVTEFESVAFNLKPGEISEPVKTDFGYHIIQLLGKLGDKINTRHILISPKTSFEDEEIAVRSSKLFDLRPYAIEQRLKLRNPIYFETSSYGHMGRQPQKVKKTFKSPYNGEITKEVELFTWEKLDYLKLIKNEFQL